MVKLIKAETNNVEECIVAEANNIKINEYEVKKKSKLDTWSQQYIHVIDAIKHLGKWNI